MPPTDSAVVQTKYILNRTQLLLISEYAAGSIFFESKKILELLNWKIWECILNVEVIEQLLTFFPILRLVTLISSDYFWRKVH